MSLNFQEIVAQRRSVRDFHADPLSDEQIEQILLDAQQSPSSCNTQPWVVHVVSGDAKDRLSAALMRAFDEGGDTHDFGYDIANYPGVYAERRDAQAAKYYEALKIARSDTAARTEEVRRNLEFFNAPHVALIFIPNVVNGDVQNSADVGMYTQTFLLSLVSRGLGGLLKACSRISLPPFAKSWASRVICGWYMASPSVMPTSKRNQLRSVSAGHLSLKA